MVNATRKFQAHKFARRRQDVLFRVLDGTLDRIDYDALGVCSGACIGFSQHLLARRRPRAVAVLATSVFGKSREKAVESLISYISIADSLCRCPDNAVIAAPEVKWHRDGDSLRAGVRASVSNTNAAGSFLNTALLGRFNVPE